MAEERRDHNSRENQRIKGQFVDKHVYACVSSMVEYILGKSWEDSDAPFNWDDVENRQQLGECYGTYANFEGGSEEARDEEVERLEEIQEKLEEEKSELEDKLEELDDATEEEEEGKENEERVKLEHAIDDLDGKLSVIYDEISELKDLEQDDQEIYEWWLVSDFMCRKLKDLGHPVIDGENIWGRCTSGQAILLDYSISQICEEMGILDGQRNSWAETK